MRNQEECEKERNKNILHKPTQSRERTLSASSAGRQIRKYLTLEHMTIVSFPQVAFVPKAKIPAAPMTRLSLSSLLLLDSSFPLIVTA